MTSLEASAERGIQVVRRREADNWVSMRRVECAVCGASEERKIASSLPPSFAERAFVRSGWSGFGRRVVCGACCLRRSKKNQQESGMEKASNVTALNSYDITNNTVRVMKLLDEHYDPDKFTYKGAFGDLDIAKITGCAPEFVARVRVAAHGAPKCKEVEDLKAELATIQSLVAEFNNKLERFEKVFFDRIAGGLGSAAKR
jgi:hypothetical protein